MKQHHDFTEDDDALLSKGKSEGLSLGQICAKYFPTHTKNSLSGRWYRLGMQKKREIRLGSAKPKTRAKKRQEAAANRSLKPKANKNYYVEASQVLLRRPVRFQALKPHMCKWPVNDPGPKEFFMFCGMRRANDKDPYCSAHAMQAYR